MTNEALACSLRQCITSDWYKSPLDHRCPHDAWVESITIVEPSSGERHQNRGLEIKVRLLGSYHDGVIEYTYKGAQNYSVRSIGNRAGHGDWIEDEVEIGPHDVLRHKITLVRGSLEFEADYIEYRWSPFSLSGKGT